MARRRMRHPDRVLSIVLGTYFAGNTFSLIGVWRNGESSVFFEWLWPWVFLAAGVVTLAYAVRQDSRFLCAASVALMVGAWGSRAITLIYSAGAHQLSWSRALFGATTFAAASYLVAYVWVKLMARLTVKRSR
jgi:hypothetical protein